MNVTMLSLRHFRRLVERNERKEKKGTFSPFSHFGSRMMLAQTVAMVFLDDKQGLGSRRIYWERKDKAHSALSATLARERRERKKGQAHSAPLWLAKEKKERQAHSSLSATLARGRCWLDQSRW